MLLDENLAEAWAGLGLYYNGPPPQSLKSIPVLERALAINPNLINASNWLVLSYWAVNRSRKSKALLDDIAERDPLYKPAIGNRTFQLTQMGRNNEARAYLDSLKPFFEGGYELGGNQAWVDFAEGKAMAGLERMQAALEKKPTDRVFRVGVNWGNYLTHQFDQVIDDHWSDYPVWALFYLGRNEEAAIVAQERAAEGVVGPLFALLNATDKSSLLIDYFEDRWPDFDAFQRDVPGGMLGYREMADLALAYRRAGDQARFDEAMMRLDEATRQSLSDGINGHFLLISLAA